MYIPEKYKKYNLIPNRVKNNDEIFLEGYDDKDNWCVVKYTGYTDPMKTLINGNYYFMIPIIQDDGLKGLYLIDETEQLAALYNIPVKSFDVIEDPSGILMEIFNYYRNII